MTRRNAALTAWLTIAGLASCVPAAPAPEEATGKSGGDPQAAGRPAAVKKTTGTRNPFGFEDIEDCCGEQSHEFAKTAPPLGRDDDPNAAQWAERGAGPFETVDGYWAGRWNQEGGEWKTGTATVRTVDGHVFVHYHDESDYLIEAERDGDLLIGRYQGMTDPLDHSPWVGKIVGDDRIDGAWILGRWDFRRGGGSD